MIDAMMDKARKGLGMLPGLFAEGFYDTLLTYDQDQLDLLDRYLDMAEEFKQIMTRTTRESIADSIVQGFLEGKSSAQDFADDFEQMMKQATIEAFKREVMTENLKWFYDFFSVYAEGGLTPEERDQLKFFWENSIKDAKEAFQALQDITGIDLTDVAAGQGQLAGAIGRMTEDTANVLAGQFNAIRENTAGMILNSRSIDSNVSEIFLHIQGLFSINARIMDNTEYCRRLESIDNTLKSMRRNESGRAMLRSVGGV